MRTLITGVAFALFAVVLSGLPSQGALGSMGGGVADEIEAPEQFTSLVNGKHAFVALDTIRPPYTFFPQGGTQGADLYTSNHVDLNPGATYDITSRGLDFECTDYSYQGHTGHDSIVEGFREQEIGVPIFAVLDGTVSAAHDGEPDQQTVNLANRPANFVALTHAGGYQTYYYHLKTGSVAVAVGQRVAAGTQLGLTGSSGNSSWPHLHFTSLLNGSVFEPSAGPCRSGSSAWVSQPPIRRDTFVTAFTYGTADFSGDDGYPFDQVTRRGSYPLGTRTIYFRFGYRNRPANSTYRLTLTRPDGSTAMDNSGSFGASAGHHLWSWFSRNVTLNATGTWTLTVFINNDAVATAPFLVSDSVVPNRAPFAVRSVALEPSTPTANDATICRVTPETLYRRDPDYDIVRYRYYWTVGGVVVRDVTTAGLADMIPSGTVVPGAEVRCNAQPTDGSLTAATATVAATAAR